MDENQYTVHSQTKLLYCITLPPKHTNFGTLKFRYHCNSGVKPTTSAGRSSSTKAGFTSQKTGYTVVRQQVGSQRRQAKPEGIRQAAKSPKTNESKSLAGRKVDTGNKAKIDNLENDQLLNRHIVYTEVIYNLSANVLRCTDKQN